MFLVVVETQRVKGYLFASRILRETRGASLLLDRLNREEARRLARKKWNGVAIYLGGGSGRVTFARREEAEGFARELRELYRTEARDAWVSVELVEREAGEGFVSWMSRGVERSRLSKRASRVPVPLIGGRWLRPCTSCGQRPAESVPGHDVQGDHRLCTACRQKREEARELYREVKGNLDRGVPVPRARVLKERRPGSVLTTLAEKAEERFGGARLLLPRDFEDIGDRSRPRNYFAFLYADGNRMGETIRSLRERFPEEEEAKRAYAAFSEIVDQATREAAVEAVLSEVEAAEVTAQRGERAWLVPAEMVVAGGDDLILVVPAQAGLAVAARFVEEYQKRTRSLQEEWVRDGRLARLLTEEPLTMSAGVVLAHASYPASQLLELALELMKIAKRRAADLAEEKRFEGTVDFLVLHEAGSERIKKRRRKEYRSELPTRMPVYLTERPYTATELRRLCEQIRALKASSVPRTKLKALYSVLFRSPLEAQFEALRIKDRLQATGDLEGDRGQALAGLAALDRFPFRERPGFWSTPLTELIEAFDFVPEKVTGG
jgi:CRISPR/Cas system-associated protein Cas10 (large subunit of type III CRISPR-Cas system)